MKQDIPSRWTLKTQQQVFSCPIFKIYEKRFAHPIDHREGTFYASSSEDWVQVVALTEDNQIVLVRQFRFGTETISLETPGGIIEYGEDPLVAAERELLEETGYAGNNQRYLSTIYPNPAIQSNKLHIVLIENCRQVSEQHLDNNEEITYEIASLENCLAKIRSGEIHHGIAALALYTYANHGL